MEKTVMEHRNGYRARLRDYCESVVSPVTKDFDLSGKPVVVRAPNWLGDNLIAMPAVYRLRQSLGGQTQLIIVCKSHLAPLWRLTDWIDRVIDFAGSRLNGEATAALRCLHPGAVLVLPNSLGSALDFRLIGNIPIRVGRSGRGRRLLLTHCLPPWRRRWRHSQWHQANHYFDLVEVVCPVQREWPRDPVLQVPDTVIETLRKRFASIFDSGRPLLLIAPGAAYGPAKRWPVTFFRQVAGYFARAGFYVAVVGTAEDRGLADIICQDLEWTAGLCGETTLVELAGLLRLARVCLCNDSGTMHLAAALGTGGVAVFGSTSAGATGPLGDNWTVLIGEADCRPCFQPVCRRRKGLGYQCLNSISPDQVIKALGASVSAYGSQGHNP